MDSKRRLVQRIALACAVLALVAGVSVFAVRPPVNGMDVLVSHLRTATGIIVVVASLSASELFAVGVRKFRKELRVAYSLLVLGVSLFALALIQIPVVSFFDWWHAFWVASGMIILPFVCATTLIYVGIRQFAVLIQVRHILQSYPVAVGIGTAFTLLSFAAGHYIVKDHAVAGTDFYTAVVGWSAIYLTFAALLARSILRQIGEAYQVATRWLFRALALLAASAWHEYTINFFMNNHSWYVSHGLSFVPFIISGLVLLRAGYQFCLLGVEAVPYIPVAPEPTAVVPSANNDYIASITLLATLAARQDTFKPLLDSAKSIANDESASQALPAASQQQLRVAYQGAEDYLVQHDPLRTYDRQELRNRLDPAFRKVLERTSTVPKDDHS